MALIVIFVLEQAEHTQPGVGFGVERESNGSQEVFQP